jgi:protein tyrosine/serine phosphatase
MTTQTIILHQVCTDRRNLPIYVHCLDGKRTTSLLVTTANI